jgi:hypothetical protein
MSNGCAEAQSSAAVSKRGIEGALIAEISELDRDFSDSRLDGRPFYQRPLASQVRNFGTSVTTKTDRLPQNRAPRDTALGKGRYVASAPNRSTLIA